jgi:DNA-binding NtrC family response regulator
MQSILIVDDMESIHEMLDTVIQPIGYSTVYARTGEEAISIYKEQCPEIVLTDLKMPNMDGLELMSRIKEIDSNAVVIMMSGHADVDNALASLKLGAFDYLTKPFKVDQLMSALNRASELIKVNVASEEHDSSIALLGDSAAAQKLKERVSQIAASHSPALIQGLCGVQKSLLAAAIHHVQFAEEPAPFVTFDCSEHSDSDLKDDVTGSDNSGGQLVNNAKGGTLHITNFHKLSKENQVAVGSLVRDNGSKVRFLFSTSEDIEGKVAKGEFDDSLFHLISSQTVDVPGLDERSEDIPLLVNSILQGLRKDSVSLSDEARSLLQGYQWPGNFAELKEVVEAASRDCKDDVIRPADLPNRIQETDKWPNLADYIEQASEEYKRRILRACLGDPKKASAILGCEVSDLS